MGLPEIERMGEKSMKDRAINALINTLNNGLQSAPQITKQIIRQYQQSQLFYVFICGTLAIIFVIIPLIFWIKWFKNYKKWRNDGGPESSFLDTDIDGYVDDVGLEIVTWIGAIMTFLLWFVAIIMTISACDSLGNYMSPITSIIADWKG